MQIDFHYYSTYCAACLAGCSHEESLAVAYADQFTDLCSITLLKKLGAPRSAATTQIQTELMNVNTGILGLQNVTRIWASFHFLPRDLYARHPSGKRRPKNYMNKFRLICGPNGSLAKETVELAKGRGLQAAGIAMHVLADTWAHTWFAGTPAAVINNTSDYFFELVGEEGEERPVRFIHNPAVTDSPEKSLYVNSVKNENENSIMNLGHGRAGHLPDYSYVRYRYLPAWGDYEQIEKDNPSDYYSAFCQMICAMKYLRGETETFEPENFESAAGEYESEIREIIAKRQLRASEDWKAFGEKLSGREIEDFDVAKYQRQYLDAKSDEKDETFLGAFFLAAMAQKSMVTHRIFESGNILAGFSVDYARNGFKGIKDFESLLKRFGGEK